MTLLVKFPYKCRFFRPKMLAVILILITAANSQSSRKVLAEFEHNGPLNLSHVAVDLADGGGRQALRRWHSGKGGDIYLGGGNVLYQLDSQLRLKHRIETGNGIIDSFPRILKKILRLISLFNV